MTVTAGWGPARREHAPLRCGLVVALLVATSCRSSEPATQATAIATPLAGAVVCEHPLATRIGLDVLEAGGNAADAAVATALALAVVLPRAGNLGGGGFALWVPHGGVSASYDFREECPAAYEASLYLNAQGEVVPERSLSTPLAVGVPGSPAGLFELFKQHGSKRFSFPQLCQPAIDLAEQGFLVDPWLARSLRSSSARRLRKDPAASALFYPEGEALEEGDILRQPELGRTLRIFGRRGPPGFYRGEVAESIVKTLRQADRRQGGVTQGNAMTLEDLEGYRVESREPLVGWFRGSEVISMGPPSSGGFVLLQVLAMLEGMPIDAERRRTLAGAAVDAGDGLSARAVHWWIEALRRAFADRAEHLGDPDMYPVPVKRLLGSQWVTKRRVSIGERSMPDVAPWAQPPSPESAQTTHLSVVDRQGNAVSMTTTLNGSYGSGIFVKDCGFLLNNELDDFSIATGVPNMYGLVGAEANQLAPDKRPLSSMTPTIVRDGGNRVSLVLGSPGGPRIITAVTQVLLRVLVYGQDLETAVSSPRLHQQWKPAATRFELGWPDELRATLADVHGHDLAEPADTTFGSVQAIAVDEDGVVVGVSDPRAGGAAGIQGELLEAPRRPR
ncbi:MAG: gamma-glutamyltransferase [bacterium]|nr:gamma-glutamyltransferase [bacterium]